MNNDMIYNQLGTTFTLEWPVYIEDDTVLSDLDITVYVSCSRFKKQMDITVDNNTVTFTFQGIDQKVCGEYDLILYINEGKADQVILKNKKVFKLYR